MIKDAIGKWIAAKKSPAAICYLAFLNYLVAPHIACQVLVIDFNLAFQVHVNLFDALLSQPFPTELFSHILFGHEDESDLATIPRTVKTSRVHGDAAVVVEIQRKQNCLPCALQSRLNVRDMSQVETFPIQPFFAEMLNDQLPGFIKPITVAQVVPPVSANHSAKVVPLTGALSITIRD